MDSLSPAAILLILTSEKEDAEGLIRLLHKGGLAVQGILTSMEERLQELVSANEIALILCCDYDAGINLDAWMWRCQELDLDIPLLIIADEAAEPAHLTGALRAGARALITKGDSDRLQQVVARELADLEHRQNEGYLLQRLNECETGFLDLVDASREATAFVRDGIQVHINPAYRDLYGFLSNDEIEGYPLLDLIVPDFHQEVRDTLRSVEQGSASVPAELNIESILADGEQVSTRLIVSRSTFEGQPCVRVITEKQMSKVVRAWPETLDRDTGLPSRSAVLDELDSRIADARLDGKSLSLIYVGICVFPQLLQDGGLSGGLASAARFGLLLREMAPAGSYLARVADDGYLLLTSDQRQDEILELAAEIRQKVRLPTERELDETGTPQCATGISCLDAITATPTDLIDAAYRDYLLDLAGTTQIGAGTPGALDKIAVRIAQAPESDDFQLLYQPIVSLKGDSQENYNVLLHLQGDNRPLLEAKDFLGAAIKPGKMVEIDRWVIRHAIAELAAQRSKGRKVNFFVSLAEETIQEEKLLIWICDALRSLDARGNWLTLQVLEAHTRRHATILERLSEGLRKVSCRIVLDRFGEAENPESALRNLRPDFVKLMPDLAQDLADDKSKQQRLRELTKLCRETGVKSVATGIEDASPLTVLWTAGIDYVQGNFLGQPSPVIGHPPQI